MKTVAIIPAAGSGVRMGGSGKKQFFALDGKPILAHTLSRLLSSPMVDEAVLVVPADEKELCHEIIDTHKFSRVSEVVEGGITRQESVFNGFDRLPGDTDIVLVHDGVRPFVTARMIEKTIRAAAIHGAAIAAVRVKDSLKKVNDGQIIGALSRDDLVRAQTPQCFRYETLRQGLVEAARDGFVATDESSLVERQGILVQVVEGSETNLKITTPEDLKLAEALLNVITDRG